MAFSVPGLSQGLLGEAMGMRRCFIRSFPVMPQYYVQNDIFAIKAPAVNKSGRRKSRNLTAWSPSFRTNSVRFLAILLQLQLR
jgi:hypothetical protein